jgi:Ca-activated chloride channel family protein
VRQGQVISLHGLSRLAGVVCALAVVLPRAHSSDIRVDSNLVLIPVTVSDARNRPIIGMRRESFRVFDGRAEQDVVHFASEDEPVSVGVVFDTSGSMKGKLGSSREAVARFLEVSNPQDEFFLVDFSSTIQVSIPFTPNPGDIRSQLMFTEPKGRTALLDAARQAMEYMKHARNPRRALLIISDGGDNYSRYSENEIRHAVREADLRIYSIGIYDTNVIMLPEEDHGSKLLADLALESGGRHFAARSASELPNIAGKIGLELRNQYVIGYRPSSLEGAGKYHRVQVKLVDGRGLSVAARPGYYEPR